MLLPEQLPEPSCCLDSKKEKRITRQCVEQRSKASSPCFLGKLLDMSTSHCSKPCHRSQTRKRDPYRRVWTDLDCDEQPSTPRHVRNWWGTRTAWPCFNRWPISNNEEHINPDVSRKGLNSASYTNWYSPAQVRQKIQHRLTSPFRSIANFFLWYKNKSVLFFLFGSIFSLRFTSICGSVFGT